jgi:hypothetical protein
MVGRGSAIADFDNDGDIDIAVSIRQPLQLLRNDGKHGGWIGFVLRGKKSNRQGVGARLTLETDAGKQVRESKAGDSYLSSSDRAHSLRPGNRRPSPSHDPLALGPRPGSRDFKPGRYQTIEEPAS